LSIDYGNDQIKAATKIAMNPHVRKVFFIRL
jgi:hypothetical protein